MTRTHTRTAIFAFTAAALFAAAGDRPRAAGDDLRLVVAARKDDGAAVRALLRSKADVSTAEADGSTALLWAAYHSNVEATRSLIAAGANVNTANRYGLTPLLQASRIGNMPIIDALVKAGARVDVAQSEGETPLMAAAASGAVDAVRLFLAKGADANASETAMGQTALMWAANEGHVKVIETLLEAGANANAVGKVTGLSRNAVTIAGGRMWTDYTSGGLTALMFAARQGHVDVTRRLVDGGANPSAANPDGLTPMIIAIINDHIDVAVLLADKGANANDGSLYEAVGLHNIRTNETVGEATRPRPRGQNTVSPVDLIAKLLDRGADPMRPAAHVLHADTIGQPQTQATNQSAFARALAAQDADALRLMAKKMNVNDVAAAGTPLMQLMGGGGGGRFAGGFGAQPAGFRYAGTRSAVDAAKAFIASGADVNVQRQNGDTALHLAAQAGNVPMIQLLADNGAKFDLKNTAGFTPLDLAMGRGAAAAPAAPAGRGGGAGGRGGGPPAGGPQPQAIVLLRQLMGLPPLSPEELPAAPQPAGARGGN